MVDVLPTSKHWLSIHEKLATRVRRAILILATFAAVAAIDAFAELEHRQERFLFARKFALELQAANAPLPVALDLFAKRCPSPEESCAKNGIAVTLQEIPEIRLNYGLFLAQNHPERKLRIMNYKVSLAAFGIALALGPLGVLALIYLRVRTIGQVASRLRSEPGDPDEIRQRLNSIFSDHVADSGRDGSRVRAVLWASLLWALAVTPSVLLAIGRGSARTNTHVLIQPSGRILAFAEMALDGPVVNVPPADTMAALVVSCAAIATVLAVLIARSAASALSDNWTRA